MSPALRKRNFILGVFLTFFIPISFAVLAWNTRARNEDKFAINKTQVAAALKNASALSFADVVASPGSGVWQTTDSGLKYLDLTIGQGPTPQTGQEVIFLYAMRLEDGKVIASSRFDLKNNRMDIMTYVYGYTPLPDAWTEAVSTMKVGGWRRFILPPNQTFGKTTLGGIIPDNASVTVDAQLLYLDSTIRSKDTYQ